MTGTRHAPPLFVGVRCMGAAVKTSGTWLAALCSGAVAVAMLIAVEVACHRPWPRSHKPAAANQTVAPCNSWSNNGLRMGAVGFGSMFRPATGSKALGVAGLDSNIASIKTGSAGGAEWVLAQPNHLPLHRGERQRDMDRQYEARSCGGCWNWGRVCGKRIGRCDRVGSRIRPRKSSGARLIAKPGRSSVAAAGICSSR